jgi:hypothetical protein
MGMNREFTPYDRSLKLKELGFNEPCITKYVETSRGFILELTNICTTLGQLPSIDAPTFSQAFRWFREEYDIIHNVDRIFQDEFGYTITPDDNEPINGFCFNTYEEAELACLDKLIEIVESKNK